MTEPAAAPDETATLSDAPTDVIKVERDGQDWFVKYYLPSDSAPATRAIDLPESYFSPSAVELQSAYASQVRKREQMTEAPLLTKRLREREEAEKSRAKAARWPQTRVRVKFADRSQLESVFESRQTIDHVYKCVRAALSDEVASKDFVLYQTPPKKDYRANDPAIKGKSLMDLQLTPNSMFYIRFPDGVSPVGTDNRPPLKEQVLAKATELPIPPPEPPASASTGNDTKGGKSSAGRTLGFGGDKGKVIPKWMKLGGPGSK